MFADTEEGIAGALQAGATVLWANTVLFSGHPLEAHRGRVAIVGQLPERQQAADDKFATNALLKSHGLPVAGALLAGREAPALERLAEHGLHFPLVVKPVRGRGSQGVSRVDGYTALVVALQTLLDSRAFGNQAIVEQYLGGDELTLTVLPGAAGPLLLPPVRRLNHIDGIAPYNGTVAVSSNSAALTAEEAQAPQVRGLMAACAQACDLVGARAAIRIDCRADGNGNYHIFDLNLKPNMTGAGRPGREDQDSLCAIAARAHGWSYTDLLAAMLASAWTE
ncbi:biotin carboxylase [Duganella sp. P38]|uniref:biotin carboxylase n=1 Tax=Duganella sp. P38 TaxID=3423949 RepID=UPI003D7A93CA